jgi:hypothetical protein
LLGVPAFITSQTCQLLHWGCCRGIAIADYHTAVIRFKAMARLVQVVRLGSQREKVAMQAKLRLYMPNGEDPCTSHICLRRS